MGDIMQGFLKLFSCNHNQDVVQHCYFIQEITQVVSTGHQFSDDFLNGLGVSREARYHETLESAKKALREIINLGDSSHIIIELNNMPKTSFEKTSSASLSLKRNNITLLTTPAYLSAIYFVPYDKPASDFIQQGKSASKNKKNTNG